MAYDEISALRIRVALDGQSDVVEKRMMGGVCFMVTGHMLGGVRTHKDGVNRFMFRVGKDREANALAKPGAERVTMGARKMPGFIYVAADRVDDAALQGWVALALDHIAGLPLKK